RRELRPWRVARVLPGDVPERHREREVLGVREELPAHDELGPAREKPEERRDSERRRRERQHDPEERLRRRGAVEARGLLELLRDGVDVALEVPDRERERARREREPDAEQRVAQVE